MQPLDVLLIAIAAGAFWLLIIRPSRQRRTAQESLMSNLAPGRSVMTAAGVFGTVVSLHDDRVIVEVAPGVQVEMLAQAIAKVLDEPVSAADTSPDADGVSSAGGTDDLGETSGETDRG